MHIYTYTHFCILSNVEHLYIYFSYIYLYLRLHVCLYLYLYLDVYPYLYLFMCISDAYIYIYAYTSTFASAPASISTSTSTSTSTYRYIFRAARFKVRLHGCRLEHLHSGCTMHKYNYSSPAGIQPPRLSKAKFWWIRVVSKSAVGVNPRAI